EYVRKAEILIVAVGKANLVKGGMGEGRSHSY
ncbi:unnamed protein product, partial [marine sediment metagenome]